ncbi:MAG: tetratricopeptide repeat protein [Abditibacteriales bacterium]|nr:tetratricopeptide repeat protein [Abditibacteriales bacterium]MDW8366417.1 tetratricopeptide repeat protein [Abditibacteriales bacterium]
MNKERSRRVWLKAGVVVVVLFSTLIAYRQWRQRQQHRLSEAHFQAGRKAYVQKNFDKAIKELSAAVRADPSSAHAWFWLGRSHTQRRNLHQAMHALRRARDLAPRDINALLGIGQVWMSLGKFDEAEKAFRDALAIDPNDPTANRLLGQVIVLHAAAPERVEEAKQYLTCALQFRPGYSTAHYWLGRAYLRSQQPLEALNQFQAAVRYNPFNVGARYHLGITYVKLGMKKEGERELAEFRRLNHMLARLKKYYDLSFAQPKAQWHFEMAKILAENRFYESAIEQYQMGLKLDPRNRAARRAIAQLEQYVIEGTSGGTVQFSEGDDALE